MFRKIGIIILLTTTFAVAQDNGIDRIGAALDSVGFTRSDLGYQAKGYWNRFPQPDGIPYVMPFFKDLFAEPLQTIPYTQAMGNTIRQYLEPAFYDSTDISLHRISYILGVDRMMTGFRNYSTNLSPRIDSTVPMLDAFEQVYLAEGQQLNFMAFGSQADWPNYKAELESLLVEIPNELQIIIAELMLNVYDAYKWRNIGIRNVDTDDALSLFSISDMAESMGDGQKYYPQIDDIAGSLDAHSLYYGCMKAAQAAETASKKLKTYLKSKPEGLDKIAFEFNSPMGRIVIAGTGKNEHDKTDCAILVDLGGNDTYTGNVGGTSSFGLPIAVAIDCGGNDKYINDDPGLLSQGAGMLGAGILIDVSGKDEYKAKKLAQGCGFFGLGILLDVSGDDDYELETSGQGCGYFGIGMNLDISGDDTRYLFGDGQGFGGVGGVGVCADYEGDDKYTAEPYEDVAHRGDYHSENKINVNSAQGAGMGRRGDGSDGHSWAGGLGALIDIKGKDHYYSGNWTLGCGYWFGTGLVYEGEGDDLYESVYFTQASGAHFCIGAIVDEGGNDTHRLWETAGAGIAFGWDFTNAILYDKGGDDRYEAKIISIACAQIRSNAFLIDDGGNDYYQLQTGQQGFGAATFRDDYTNVNKLSPYNALAKSFSLLLDIGGTDTYMDWDSEKDETSINSLCGNNRTWFKPARDDEHYGADNFGVGMDVEGGAVPEAEMFE
ncbi:MAG: hypothetical protein V3W18_13575 [candidate division Zixibacteria bacterium]